MSLDKLCECGKGYERRLVDGTKTCTATLERFKALNGRPLDVTLMNEGKTDVPDAKEVARCWCRTCRPITLEDMRFVVCPDCGNKRCPKANDHRHDCSGSNEPGQPGSAYE